MKSSIIRQADIARRLAALELTYGVTKIQRIRHEASVKNIKNPSFAALKATFNSKVDDVVCSLTEMEKYKDIYE